MHILPKVPFSRRPSKWSRVYNNSGNQYYYCRKKCVDCLYNISYKFTHLPDSDIDPISPQLTGLEIHETTGHETVPDRP